MRDDNQFDPNAPEKQMSARKLPWRPVVFVIALCAVVATAIAVDRTVVEQFWPFGKEERERPERKLLSAFDVHASDWEPTPPVPPEPIVMNVDRFVDRPILQTLEVTKLADPPPPVQEPAPAGVVIQRVALSDQISYVVADPQAPVTDMIDGRVPSPAQGCVLQPGLSVIHATLMDEVRWDVGGQVAAIVTRPVVSPERPDWVLIPEGAQLVGYASLDRLERGMDLAPAPIWQTASWIDSDTGERRTRSLQDASGANVSGVNGIGGEVDARWGPIIGLMALTTVFETISSININLGESSDVVNARIGGSGVGRIGEMVAQKMLDIEPRITTQSGTQIVVKVNRPIRMC